MAELGLMIEGQDGLNWQRWERILDAAERLGYQCVFRSDHFTNPTGPHHDALDPWASLTYAASRTSRIEFGPLVSPVTFRLPAITAEAAIATDTLSNGRLVLGLGAGWQEREHEEFGIPFPPTNVRMDMLVDYLEVVTRLLRSDEPVSYEGRYYQLHDAMLLPRPSRPGGPPILVGGTGRRRTLPIAARYADEWNAVYSGPEELRELMPYFDRLLEEAGRPRSAVKRSLMAGTIFARDDRSLREKLEARGTTVEQAVENGLITGTPKMWVEQLNTFAEIGVERFMLQWLEMDNIEDLEIIAREVMPAVATGR